MSQKIPEFISIDHPFALSTLANILATSFEILKTCFADRIVMNYPEVYQNHDFGSVKERS